MLFESFLMLICYAHTVIYMYTVDEKELDCGCCIELTVSRYGKSVKVICHSLEEGMEKAKKELS